MQTDLDCTSNKISTIPSVTTIVSKTVCKEPLHRKVERYDFAYDAVPANDITDVLVLTSGIVKESGEMFFQRLVRSDMWLVYIIITVVNILFLVSAISGIYSSWYINLKKSGINPYIIGTLWVIATILSYGAIFMIWEHVTPDQIPLDLHLSIYFLIGNFLSLVWVTILFQANNIILAVWFAALLFLYEFWLFIYIWITKITAALYMIPLIILYGYLFYSMVHLASLNNIGL